MEKQVLRAVDDKIEDILNEGLNAVNLNHLYQLIDIKKDICEIERSDSMHYDTYGARMRDSRGRYMGHDYIDAMHDHYGRYEEGRGAYNRGNYGAKESTLNSLEYMLRSLVSFVDMLKEEAVSPEEKSLIHQYLQKISK